MKALVLLGLLGVSAAHATDWHMEVGMGESAYRTYGDGIWYQMGMPHHLDTSGRFGLIGVTGHINDDWQWHADYVNFGKSSAGCWCTADDNYDAGKHVQINIGYPLPPGKFNGYGDVQGIQLKVNRWFSVGSYDISPDVGLLVYRNAWKETVYGWRSFEYPNPIDGVHQADRRIRVGGIIGLSVKAGKWTASIDEYLMKPVTFKYDNPPLWRNVLSAYVTYEL